MKKITKYQVSRKMYEEAYKEVLAELPVQTNETKELVEALRIKLFYRKV
jgi:hypothetical protein